MDMKRERSYIKETFHFPDRTARSITSLLQAAEGLIRRSQLSPPLLKHTKLLIPLMTSFCTPLPDLSSQIQPIRCQHGSCVVTVVMATLALLHLPILIQSPSPRAPSLPLFSLPSVFIKRIPIWPAVLESSCSGADAVNSAVSVFVNTALSKHTECRNINTIVPVCRLV